MKIEVAVSKNNSTKDKGDLLEEMTKNFLEIQNFFVDTQIRKTGVELDLLCKGKANPSKQIYVECKAYDSDSKVSADIITKLHGTRGINKYHEAWLVSTSQLTKDAKGLVEKIEKGEEAKYFIFYTPDKLIQAFIDARFVCNPSVARQKIIDLSIDENKIRGEILLVTEFGYFWVFEYLKGGKPSGAVVARVNGGDIVVEEELLSNLKTTESSLKDLDFQQIFSFDIKGAEKSKQILLSDIKLSSDYLKNIDEMAVKLSHPNKDPLILSDFFIYPDMEDTREENRIISSRTISFDDDSLSQYVLFGGEVSGKTSLAYMIQKETNSSDNIVLYIKSDKIKKSSFDNFTNLLVAQFKKQFSDDKIHIKFFENLISTNRSKIIIIIDDFDLLAIKNTVARTDFIKMLQENFNNILIFANKSFEIEMMTDSVLKEDFKDFKIFRIKQLGHLLRDELINKWLTIGGVEMIPDDDLYNKKIEIAGKINFAVGTNFVPTHPLYILTMLQLIEAGSKLKLQGSSYADLYKYLITQSLESVNAKPEDLDFYLTYLSFLSHYFFLNHKKELSKIEMIGIYNEYCNKMDISKDFDVVHNLLVRAKLVMCENQHYLFSHNYAYYYFVAKYLSDNIGKIETMEEMDMIIEKIYKNEFANIIIFFIHHSKHSNIIDKILQKSADLLKDVVPYTLSSKEMNHINNLIHEEIELSIEDLKASDNRKADLAERDRIDNNKRSKRIDDCEEGERQLNMFDQISLSMKLMQILGQIATSYYGSIDGKRKQVILDEICSLGLRSMHSLLEDFQGYLEGIRSDIEVMIDKKKQIGEANKKKIVDKIIYSFQEIIVFVFIKNISDSVASKNLFVSTDKIAERNDTPAGKIISTAVRMNFPNEIHLNKLLILDNEFKGNHLAKGLIRMLTAEHLYKFDVKYNEKQRICQKLNIEIKTKNKSIT